MKERFRNLAAIFDRMLDVDSDDPEIKRRGRLLMQILAILFCAVSAIAVVNLWIWLMAGGERDQLYLYEDLVFLVALVGMWAFIRRTRRVFLAAHIVLFGYMILAFLFLDAHGLSHALLVFVVPIVLGGFIIKPWYAFPYAALVFIGWLVANIIMAYPVTLFNYILNAATLMIISVVTYVTSTHLNGVAGLIIDSEKKYRSIFDNVPIGLYRTTVEGRILDANPTFLKMFGYSDLPSLQRLDASSLYADPSSRLAYVEPVDGIGVHISELHMRDVYGRTFWVADYVRQIKDKDGKVKVFEGSLIDISARRLAEDASLETLARLEALVGNMPQGVLFEDEQRSIQFANRTFCSMFGIPSVGTLLGVDCSALAAQAKGYFLDPEGFIQGIDHHLAEKQTCLAEELALVDGRIFERDYIPIFMAGKYVGSYWLYRDITDRKRAVEALHHREAILEIIGDASQRFLKTEDWERDIDPVLAKLGEAVRASRAYIFQNAFRTEGVRSASQRFEWVATGITPQIENPDLQNIPMFQAGFGRWMEVLANNELILGLVREFPPSERELLSAQDILSLVIVPVFDGDEWWGFIGFDDCRTERTWLLAETEALKAFAGVLGAAIQRQRFERTLRHSEERYRGLFNGMVAGFALHEIICNDNGKPVDYRFLDINPEFERMSGMKRESLIGHTVLELLPETESIWIEKYGKVALTGEPSHFQQFSAAFGKYFEVTAFSPRRGQFAVTFFDITEKVQAQERIQEQIERLAALRTIDSVITASTDLSLSLNAILDQTIIHLHVDAADILLLNPTLNVLEYAAGKGFHTRGIAQSRVRLGEGYAGRSALTRSLIHIHELKTASPPFERANLLTEEKFSSCYVVPLIAKGNVVGVLEAFHRTQVNRDREWLDFLESMAAQAAIGIDNATLFENLQRSNMDLSMAYEITLEGWTAALDLRDKEAEGHTRRVTELTQRIAMSMGIHGTDLVNIRRGALLHDIGKMGVPDKILFKEDDLDEEEWQIMRKHPQVAYNLLYPIVYLRSALDIPYCHHEKWDGTGYPRGLKGITIPLAARIFAVVDMYDTLTAERPYRRAWSHSQALDHIRSLAGTHFDPEVIDVFLHEMGEV